MLSLSRTPRLRMHRRLLRLDSCHGHSAIRCQKSDFLNLRSSQNILKALKTQPIWRICSSNYVKFPKDRGENKRYLSCHHPVKLYLHHDVVRVTYRAVTQLFCSAGQPSVEAKDTFESRWPSGSWKRGRVGRISCFSHLCSGSGILVEVGIPLILTFQRSNYCNMI